MSEVKYKVGVSDTPTCVGKSTPPNYSEFPNSSSLASGNKETL